MASRGLLALMVSISLSFSAVTVVAQDAATPSISAAEAATPPRVLKVTASFDRFTAISGADASIAGVTFAIYAEREGGTPLWVETQNVSADSRGQFTVLLGSATPLPVELFNSGEARWLGIQRIPEREQARILLASVPYALKAADAETLGGKPLSAFVLNEAESSSNGGPKKFPKQVEGTTNFIAKFVDTTNINNSLLYDSGTGVGLSTTTPLVPLHINNIMFYRGLNVSVLQSGAFPGLMLQNVTTDSTGVITESNGLLFFAKASASAAFAATDERMRITTAGNVGIATAAPVVPLQINKVSLYRNLNVGSLQVGAFPGVMLQNPTTNSTGVMTESNGLLFFTLNSATLPFAAAHERMRITTTGNVGIGVTSPAFPLSVNGVIHSASGGFRFPDATVQSTAFALPFNGAVSSTSAAFNINNFGSSGGAILASNNGTGPGLQVFMNNPASNAIGVDVQNSGTGTGVFATANGTAIHGVTTSASQTGLLGDNGTGDGILGRSIGGTFVSAVVGRMDGNGSGVRGFVGTGPISGPVPTTAVGVRGEVGLGGSTGNAGRFENSNGQNSLPALVATTNGAVAASFTGAVQITGNLSVSGTVSKGGGSFKIDHPLDPENRYLSHSFVESPDMKNVYDGVAIADANGRAIVELPSWFQALNRDFRYQLTAIGQAAPGLHIARKIENNRFEIAGAAPNMEVSWMVTGIRHDRFAERHRIPIEEMKEVENRGKYLYPDVFDRPVEEQIGREPVATDTVNTAKRPQLASDSPAGTPRQ